MVFVEQKVEKVDALIKFNLIQSSKTFWRLQIQILANLRLPQGLKGPPGCYEYFKAETTLTIFESPKMLYSK